MKMVPLERAFIGISQLGGKNGVWKRRYMWEGGWGFSSSKKGNEEGELGEPQSKGKEKCTHLGKKRGPRNARGEDGNLYDCTLRSKFQTLFRFQRTSPHWVKKYTHAQLHIMKRPKGRFPILWHFPKNVKSLPMDFHSPRFDFPPWNAPAFLSINTVSLSLSLQKTPQAMNQRKDPSPTHTYIRDNSYPKKRVQTENEIIGVFVRHGRRKNPC